MFVFENYHLWRNKIKFVTNKQTKSAPQNDHPPKLTMISYLLAINSDKQKSGFTPLMNPKFQGAPPAPPLSTALQIP